MVTDSIVGHYEARSYPDEQMDASGYYNLHKVPVYRIHHRSIRDRAAFPSVTISEPVGTTGVPEQILSLPAFA